MIDVANRSAYRTRGTWRRCALSLTLASGLLACAEDAQHGASEGADGDAGTVSDARVLVEAGSPATDAHASPLHDAHVASGDAEAAAPVDAGPCKDFVMPTDCTTSGSDALPNELRCTGLYGEFATRTLACGIDEYKPAYELWSDGAIKRRFVSLPPGEKVDASNPDEFKYPPGTKFWKEFRLQTASGIQLAETRLLLKSAEGWQLVTYVWSDDGQSARRVDDGVEDVFGTGFDVPSREQCQECHRGRQDFVLGWDWLMLGLGASGVTRDSLLASGRLESPTAAHDSQATIPGNDTERAALGYLHANCGISCHNRSKDAIAHEIGFYTRLDLATLGDVQSTDAVKTGVNHAPNWWSAAFIWGAGPAGAFYDLRPGDPTRSYALARMGVRGGDRQMPRIASTKVDERGVQLITAWIESMSTAAGYAAPSP